MCDTERSTSVEYYINESVEQYYSPQGDMSGYARLMRYPIL